MNENWVKMTKGDEEKLVHPGNVNNHLRFGWVRAEDPEQNTQAQVIVPAEPTSEKKKDSKDKGKSKSDAEVPAEPTAEKKKDSKDKGKSKSDAEVPAEPTADSKPSEEDGAAKGY